MFSSFTTMNIPRISLYQRETTTTIEDKSNIITIVTWATLGSSVLVFLARQCVKFAMGRKVGIDDLFILAATVFTVGLSVTLLALASGGLGVSGALTLRRADTIQKTLYASNFFYVLTLGFAKLSLLSFFYSVYHQRGQRRVVLAIGIFILAWTIASLATVAFQCGLPKPWEVLTLHCFNVGAFWIVYCIIDMTSDVAIVMLSINLVAYLKVKVSTKIAVIACFAPRILVIGASLVRLLYLYPITPHKSPAFTLWIPMICTQAQACLSIITACIPYVRPFFETAESSIRRMSHSRSRRGTSDEESSYGCCSPRYFRGYKRAQGNSAESTQLTSSVYGRTPDVSPRIPSPAPLSPLTPPRFNTPSITSANSSRSPSERGLRLQIPTQDQRNTAESTSPRTASSHALSPAYLSPHPLLTSIALTPVRSSIIPAVEGAQSKPSSIRPVDTLLSPNRPQPPRQFSLFPSQSQQYSSLPQQISRQMLGTLTPVTEKSRSNSGTPVQHTPNIRMVEGPTLSPSPELDKPTAPYMFPPRPSSSLERLVNDDPLRTTPMAITTSVAVPAPIPAPLPTVHDARNSIPSYYVRSPPTAQDSTFSSPQSVPSYYIATPPTAQPSTFSQSDPYAYRALPPPPPKTPTSPQRQRNKRILTPQNSSRRDQMSPVSPVTPPTPRAFRREEPIDESPETQTAGSGWEEAQLMPVVWDTRSSPRIVVQRFS